MSDRVQHAGEISGMLDIVRHSMSVSRQCTTEYEEVCETKDNQKCHTEFECSENSTMLALVMTRDASQVSPCLCGAKLVVKL